LEDYFRIKRKDPHTTIKIQKEGSGIEFHQVITKLAPKPQVPIEKPIPRVINNLISSLLTQKEPKKEYFTFRMFEKFPPFGKEFR